MYVAYVRTPIFIGVLMILDMCTLTARSFFPYDFSKFSKFGLFYKFDLILFSLSLEETDSLKFTFVLKIPYLSICHTHNLTNTSPDLRALANLGCQ